MNKIKIASLLISAVMCCQMFVSCGEKKADDNTAETTTQTAESSDVNGMNPVFDENSEDDIYDSDACVERILAETGSMNKSDAPLSLGGYGELVSPKEDAEDAELGSYYVSDNGIKLYFSEEDFPKELILTLEQYFIALENADFELYTRCILPDYYDRMEEFLAKDYDYDMKTSFAKQCANLADIMNGSFRITRIKLDKAPKYSEEIDNLEAYFGNLDEIFGTDYYSTVKESTDNFYDGEFFVMAEGKNGEESLVVSGYEIVFAEKDGRYYVFG